ncbi:MAG: FeoB-associated Cys-rich membrane protein [Oscillospiraceae bacterium]|nr:FeoB-associated Cys-rich membrane protein [Oscillospiraceae bacterium]
MGTLIVGVILGLIVFAIIRYLLKELKSGKSLCGGNCSACGGCGHCSSHKHR